MHRSLAYSATVMIPDLPTRRFTAGGGGGEGRGCERERGGRREERERWEREGERGGSV